MYKINKIIYKPDTKSYNENGDLDSYYLESTFICNCHDLNMVNNIIINEIQKIIRNDLFNMLEILNDLDSSEIKNNRYFYEGCLSIIKKWQGGITYRLQIDNYDSNCLEDFIDFECIKVKNER